MTSPRNKQVSPPTRSLGLAVGILGIMLVAGSVVYWQGRVMLVARIDEQIENEASHEGSLLELALAKTVAQLESLATQPVMARILDDDEDHEIAELLDVAVRQAKAITELSCYDHNARAIASTQSARVGGKAEPPIAQVPDGQRYALSREVRGERIVVPIVVEFDERERIGQLTALIDREALLSELDVWWAGLISESGEVLADVGENQVAYAHAGDHDFTSPDLGAVRVSRVGVKMPAGGNAHAWVLSVATPYAHRYDPIGILGWMTGLTTLFSSALVLGVAHYFSRKQRGLLTDLSDQCRRLEAATLQIEGQKVAAEAMNAELRASNAALETARVEATMATKAKSAFLANMSHEIRTPMTAILGFGDLIAEGCLKSCDFGKNQLCTYSETIRRNGEYLMNLINDILDLSKIEAGKLTVERTHCKVCEIVAEVASLMRGRSDAKNLAFHVEYVGPIPETILSDPTRLRQILINLIGNAIKFTETGAVRLVTSLIDDGDESLMQFDVIDTGLGMTDEQIAKLFQPFMQADNSTTRKFGGTGLGLTISKRFAELLGGDITIIESKIGTGTRFRATVAAGALDGVAMLDNPMAASVLTNTSSNATHVLRTDLQGLRILLAEDGPDNQRLISFVLTKAGADVTVMENGKLAMDAALAARDEGKPFDVILMDMQMPVMDGYEATGQLRQSGYTTPIIALTAHAMASDREKCIKAGCNDYATKPINREKLIEMILRNLVPVESASAAAT